MVKPSLPPSDAARALATRIEGERGAGFRLTEDSTQQVSRALRLHAKAMPVILTTEEEFEKWLTAPWAVAVKLQRPPPNELLRIVAMGEKSDAAPPGA